MTAGLEHGSPTYWGGAEGAKPRTADSNELCAPLAKSRSFHAEPEAGRAFPGPVHDCGKKNREPGPGTRAGSAGMLEGGAAGQQRPTLPARLPLPSHTLASRPAEQTQIQPSARHGGQPATLQGHGSWGHRPQLLRDAGLHSQHGNQWATLFSFSSFLLVKWSTRCSRFSNLPDTEAITTSLSALSQHRKPTKTRRVHSLQTVQPQPGPGLPSSCQRRFPFISV